MKGRPPERASEAQSEGSADADETNWLAWGLQFAFGSIVGLVAGFQLAGRMIRADFISRSQTSAVVCGLSLLIGAVAAYLGDRAWLPASVFDPPEFPRGDKARRASSALSSLGIALVVVPTVLHLLLDRSGDSGSAAPEMLPMRLLVAAVPMGLTIYALWGGSALGAFGTVERSDGALAYWLHVGMTACTALCILFGR